MEIAQFVSGDYDVVVDFDNDNRSVTVVVTKSCFTHSERCLEQSKFQAIALAVKAAVEFVEGEYR